MATATATAPTREDFAAMLEESFTQGAPQEGSVVKGTVVGIEKDLAVIDVGAKTEGRVALREFQGPGRGNEIKIGDVVEVGETIGHVQSLPIVAPFRGVVRGLIHGATPVVGGMKIGDIDPRTDTDCREISDKALSVGGGVLEAVLQWISANSS